MKKTPFISIVCPVYQGEVFLQELTKHCIKGLEKICTEYEIIYINDASPDRSWDVIREICQKNHYVKAIKLSRNFGQHAAISAGLKHAQGDYVIVMDCDLQHDPCDIPRLFETSQKENTDIVLAITDYVRHPFIKRFFSRIFYFFYNWLCDSSPKIKYNFGAFSLLSRKVVDSFNRINDYHRHYIPVLRGLGFNTSYVKIEHKKRKYGGSSYSFYKLVVHAVNGIVSQSTRLLYLSIAIGFVFFLLSMAYAIYAFIMYFIHQHVVPGWTSLTILLLLATGIILMSQGVIGVYIGKIFEQVKQRPLYLIDEMLNIEEKND